MLSAPILSSPIGRLLTVVILFVAAWPFVSLLVKRPFWGTFPKLAAGLLIALAVYATTVVLLVGVAPSLTLMLAAVAAVGIAGQVWRARPTFGQRRQLPPGSLSLVPVGA